MFFKKAVSSALRPSIRLIVLPILVFVLIPLAVARVDAQADAKSEGAAISGKVISSETGTPLSFATIVLTRFGDGTVAEGAPAGGGLTKLDGTYRIKAQPGLYMMVVSYVSYNPQTITGVEVKANATTVIDIALVPEVIKLEPLTVTARKIDNSEVAMLVQQKRSAAVSDGISSEQISKTTDSNAAEALQRVTGLSVVSGRFVYVRGLGERYSSTQVNGSTIGTPEVNKRVVPLDIFATGLLDNVVVQKTYTPDQPGEFGGGVVNVNTRDFPGQRVWDFSFGSGHNEMTTGKSYYYYEGGKYDFLGVDDGTRKLPSVINKFARNQPVVSYSPVSRRGLKPDTLQAIGRAFSDTWGKKRGSGLPAYSFASSYGNEVELLGRPFGFLGSASYGNSRQTTKSQDRYYKSDGGVLYPETSYDVTCSRESVLWGAMANGSYSWTDFTTLLARAMYNRNADNEVRFYEGDNNDLGRRVRSTRLQYVERGVFTGSLGANIYLAPLGGSKLDLRYHYSRATRNEPDRREYAYEEQVRYITDPEDREVIIDTTYVWVLSDRSSSQGFNRMFGKLSDEERGPEVNLIYPFKQWNGLESKLKLGGVCKNKDRQSTWRRFQFVAPTIPNQAERDSLMSLPPDELLIEDRIGGLPVTRYFYVNELTRSESDNYLASVDMLGAYWMMDLALARRIRAVFGTRVEKAEIGVRTVDIFHFLPEDQLAEAKLKDTDWLPSINLTFSPSDKVNARLAFSTTLSRPDLRELTPFRLSNFQGAPDEIGNPKLRRARIDNYDLRCEVFPGSTELLALSAFYKKLSDPIEKSIQLSGNNPVYRPINAEAGRLYGFELEARVALGRIGTVLKNFGASGNLTVVDSKVELNDATGVQRSNTHPLEGQSPYVMNYGLFFVSQSGRTSASLLFNSFGKRLAYVGVGELPDIYEYPRQSLDLALSHRRGGTKVKFSVENILDEDVVFRQHKIIGGGSVVTHRSNRGRSLSLSLGIGS